MEKVLRDVEGRLSKDVDNLKEIVETDCHPNTVSITQKLNIA